jgi:hypothetical protein
MTRTQQLEPFTKTMDMQIVKVTLLAMKELSRKGQQRGDISEMFFASARMAIDDNNVSDMTKGIILKYSCMLEALIVENTELRIAQSN